MYEKPKQELIRSTGECEGEFGHECGVWIQGCDEEDAWWIEWES